jgi:hypothetical protein
MTETAPHPTISDPDALYDILCHATPHRELYKTQSGEWRITYDRRPIDTLAVRRLVASGRVASVYSTHPTIGYHVGRTIDTDRTMEARKSGRISRGDLIYIGDPTP